MVLVRRHRWLEDLAPTLTSLRGMADYKKVRRLRLMELGERFEPVPALWRNIAWACLIQNACSRTHRRTSGPPGRRREHSRSRHLPSVTIPSSRTMSRKMKAHQHHVMIVAVMFDGVPTARTRDRCAPHDGDQRRSRYPQVCVW